MSRSPVRQVIPGYLGNHDMLQSQSFHRFCQMQRFIWIQWLRLAGGNVAESAVSGALTAHNHKGGRFL
ncbi:hypothetical protein SDC9_197515 [bioreactor metagenome]|uniref:Uncharacterized protein n=1 Tax=bioreactor metagenome TaxID=1076179 RepID=A0A645IEZ6_9ZZZZ